jgi:hypothetical protein
MVNESLQMAAGARVLLSLARPAIDGAIGRVRRDPVATEFLQLCQQLLSTNPSFEECRRGGSNGRARIAAE